MAAISTEAVVEPTTQTGAAVDGWEPNRYGAILAVHTTLANPFVIALLVVVIASALLLRHRRR